MTLRRQLAAWFLCCFSALILVGCNGSETTSSGTVQFEDGSPVTSGSVELRNLTDKKRYASRIATDGSFTLADEDGTVGVPAGSYEAVIVQIVLTEDLALERHTHGHTVPRRYADYYTSGLNIDLEEGQTTPIEIVVESLKQDERAH
jgi:hypothetical protein